MDIHKPKAVRGWREFSTEIGIIVLGVLIALSAEQFVDYLHWHHRVAAAEENMRAEVRINRTYATEYAIFANCADAYVDTLEADLLKRDSADLKRLYDLGPPFASRAWTWTAWEAAVNAQIADHMDGDRFLNYAEAFRRANIMRDIQFQLRDRYVEAMTGRFALPPDTKTLADELTAVEELKTVIAFSRPVTRALIGNADALGVGADAVTLAGYRKRAAQCLASLHAPHG